MLLNKILTQQIHFVKISDQLEPRKWEQANTPNKLDQWSPFPPNGKEKKNKQTNDFYNIQVTVGSIQKTTTCLIFLGGYQQTCFIIGYTYTKYQIFFKINLIN